MRRLKYSTLKKAPSNVEAEVSQGNVSIEPVVKSHPSEGILLKNPKSKVISDKVKLLRYMFKIPLSVEIRAPETHERIDWVMPGWSTIY